MPIGGSKPEATFPEAAKHPRQTGAKSATSAGMPLPLPAAKGRWPAQHGRGIFAAQTECSIDRRSFGAIPGRDRYRLAWLPIHPVAEAEQSQAFRIVARQHYQRAPALRMILSWYRRIVGIATVKGVVARESDCGHDRRRRCGCQKHPVRIQRIVATRDFDEFLPQAQQTRQAWVNAVPDLLVDDVRERTDRDADAQAENARRPGDGNL